MFHCLLIHLPVKGHLDYSQYLVIVSSLYNYLCAGFYVNIGFYFMWIIPTSGNAGFCSTFMFNFIKKLYLPVFQAVYEKFNAERSLFPFLSPWMLFSFSHHTPYLPSIPSFLNDIMSIFVWVLGFSWHWVGPFRIVIVFRCFPPWYWLFPLPQSPVTSISLSGIPIKADVLIDSFFRYC